MKNSKLIFGFLIATSLISCKTTDSSKLKDSDGGSKEGQYLQLFQSVEVKTPNIALKNASLYLAKTKKDGKITTVLYSTDGHALGFSDANNVLDLADISDTLDWDAWKKGTDQKGKIFSIQNQGTREICSRNECKISQQDKKIDFKFDKNEKSLPIQKSFERISVETKISQGEIVDISFQFKMKSISVNQAEADNSEVSIGIKCKGTTYSFDYFSGQTPNLKNLTIEELGKQLQPSIWTENGDNIIDETKENKFKISANGDILHLQVKDDLAKDLLSKCGQKIRNADIIVNGDLIKKS